MNVEQREERWTCTTIQTAFVFRPPVLVPPSGNISVDLPLPSLGWTFALSLAGTPNKKKKKPVKRAYTAENLVPAVFSFRQHGSATHWGGTSIHAQLSLQAGEETELRERTPRNNMGSNATPLGSMNVTLAHTSALDFPLTTPCTISKSSLPVKVRLSVTISGCPLPNGLFEARSGLVSEAEAQVQLVRQSCDRLQNRSLANGFSGKLCDVKFLAFSARSASGNTGGPLATYASVCVLEEYLSKSSILKEGWTNALGALNNPSAKHVGEILSPKDYEYEQDSDFEDEDEVSSSDWNCECDLADPTSGPRTGQQSDSGTERSSSSLSSFEMEGASDKGSVGYQPEEIIKGLNGLSSDYERTVWVKFAAHRTWHAFLWYCYTGNLKFGKLKSQVEPGGRHLRGTSLEGEPPTCSPKSMYRLADLIGNEDLKAKALVAIKERMSEQNVLDEAFSVFTSKYPDVRNIQLGILVQLRQSPKVKEAFFRAIEKYNSMPHAKPVFLAFYDSLVGSRL